MVFHFSAGTCCFRHCNQGSSLAPATVRQRQEAAIARKPTPAEESPKRRATAEPKPKAAPKASAKPKAAAVPKAKAAPKAAAAKAASAKSAPKPTAKAAPKTAAAKPAPKRAAAKTTAAKPAPAAPRPTRGRRREKLAPDRLQLLVEAAQKSLEDDKAENIVVLDVTGRADYTDRLIIATGQVERQLQAMATHLDEALGKAGLHLKRDAIQASPDWVLIDAGDLVIHLFRPDARELYRLERMWGPESPLKTENSDAARD
ncbi:MAG: ribosome silencing factor [Roseomonas sp.]|nr:ribosome silencing factor [Roseomonas sp.]